MSAVVDGKMNRRKQNSGCIVDRAKSRPRWRTASQHLCELGRGVYDLLFFLWHIMGCHHVDVTSTVLVGVLANLPLK